MNWQLNGSFTLPCDIFSGSHKVFGKSSCAPYWLDYRRDEIFAYIWLVAYASRKAQSHCVNRRFSIEVLPGQIAITAKDLAEHIRLTSTKRAQTILKRLASLGVVKIEPFPDRKSVLLITVVQVREGEGTKS